MKTRPLLELNAIVEYAVWFLWYNLWDNISLPQYDKLLVTSYAQEKTLSPYVTMNVNEKEQIKSRLVGSFLFHFLKTAKFGFGSSLENNYVQGFASTKSLGTTVQAFE